MSSRLFRRPPYQSLIALRISALNLKAQWVQEPSREPLTQTPDLNHNDVRQRNIQFLLICGAEDTWKDTALSFQAALKEKSIPCELKIVPAVDHQLPTLIDAEGNTAAKFQNNVFAGN